LKETFPSKGKRKITNKNLAEFRDESYLASEGIGIATKRRDKRFKTGKTKRAST